MNGPDVHGGNIERAAVESGIAASRILDFSANVNPLGLPACAARRLAQDAADPAVWSRYPDPEYSELAAAVSRYTGVALESIVIAGGADALIHAAVCSLAPRRLIIATPAFSEYRRASLAFGSETITIPLDSDFTPSRGDLIVLNNPHNPSGTCKPRSIMRALVRDARSCGAAVLVDEAFIDYSPDSSITKEAAEEDGSIAVRSLTKFFGCPGLRVGYAVAAPATAANLKAQLPPWPVTTLAANALAAALEDSGYRSETIERNAKARAVLSNGLSSLGCSVHPSSANFVFLRLPGGISASNVYSRLLREYAILVRRCDSFEGLEPDRYLRIAVRSEQHNARLIEAFASLFKDSLCAQV